MDLKETDILGEQIANHWYYRSKAAAVAKLLGPVGPTAILDVGAGSGFFSRYLLERTEATQAWCLDTGYPADFDSQASGKPIRFRRSIDSCAADLVLLMDVLEHVEDDTGLLVDSVRKVPPGARILVSVPAFQFLWSGHDEFLEHKRRYTLRRLERTMERAGLTVERGCYFFGFVFPLAMATRLAGKWPGSAQDTPQSQLKQHGHLANRILSLICRAELPVLPFNRLAGLTVFCLARRP